MRINELRGTVADRPIDAVVVQREGYPRSAMQRITEADPEVQQVNVSTLSRYQRG
jgi:hypothetical protein